MVSIRRKRTRTQSYTVIVFDKDNIHEWPTNEHEHYKGIINDYTRWKKLLSE